MPDTSSDLASKVAVVASAVAAAGLGFYLYCKLSGRKEANKVIRISDVSPAQMEELLDQLVQSQADMKKIMNNLARKIFEEDLDFVQICKVVQDVNPENPLAPYGLTIEEFSQLLAIHNANASIRKKILQLTAGPDIDAAANKGRTEELTKSRTSEDMIVIHTYMLQQLKQVVAMFKADQPRVNVDARVATIAAQAYVGKVVQKKYGLTSEDLEILTCHYHSVLQSDDRFFDLGTEMRQIVQGLVTASSGGAAGR